MNVYGDRIHKFERLRRPDTYIWTFMPTGYIYLALYADRIHIFGALCRPFENRPTLCEKIVFSKSNSNRNIHKIFCFMQFVQRTKWRVEKQHYKAKIVIKCSNLTKTFTRKLDTFDLESRIQNQLLSLKGV